jgi:hypothetical protein
MSVSVLTNALVIVNGVTLSDHGNQVTVEDMRDQVDISGFGTANKMYQKGLGDAKITVKFLQDFAASSVHATIQPLIGQTTGVAVEIRPTNSARSATNPAFLLASALVFNYKGLDGQIGNASEVTVEFVNAGTAGLTYPTS